MRIPLIGILLLVLLLGYTIVHATETGCADDDDCPADHICMSISTKLKSYKSCVAKVHKEEIEKRMQEKTDIVVNMEKSNQATPIAPKSETVTVRLMPPIGEIQQEEEEEPEEEEKDKELNTLSEEDEDDVIDFDDDDEDDE